MSKTFKLPFDYVLYEMSYQNVILYSNALPTYVSKKDKENKKENAFQADDPKNTKRLDDFFKSIKE